MPTWQTFLSNIVMRLMAKQFMRFGSVEQLRNFAGNHDRKLRAQPQDPDFTVTPVTGAFDGERLRRVDRKATRMLLYLPGGGFVMRSPVTHRRLAQRICRVADADALVVHYRLAPEHPFPQGLDDCVAAYLSLLAEGHAPGGIAIAGDSSGGNLALATLLSLRDAGYPLPGAGVLLSALNDLTYSGPSRRFNRWRDPMLPVGRKSGMHEMYLRDTPASNPLASPLLGDFTGLPPLLVQVGNTEILLDDSTRLLPRARSVGTPCYLEVWTGTPHAWQTQAALPESGWAIERIGQFLKARRLEPPPPEQRAACWSPFKASPSFRWEYYDGNVSASGCTDG